MAQELMSSDGARRFFTRNEVQQHCTEDDAYVSTHGRVLNLTPLIEKYKGPLSIPLVKAAGSDITHWFETEDELKTCVDITSGLRTYAIPFGRVPHCPVMRPSAMLDHSYEIPWWRDPAFVVGHLTRKSRKLMIVNTLTGNHVVLEVCSEETLQDILLHRYLDVNAHAHSYLWRRHEAEKSWTLDMNKTLEENGIADESDEFEALGLPTEYYIPAVHLYFCDDLTVA